MLHQFSPQEYHNALGPYAPVLTLDDGDSLATSCVDARGFDQHRQPVARRGNPMTGPFFVNGAEPGDTLAVRIDAVTPNRRYGFSTAAVAPNVVDPDYVRELPAADLVEWEVDVAAGMAIARLPAPSRNWQVPLAPMLGCFGVAPPRQQAISTATSGPYGGNMDYRHFVAGATVLFPVFEPGALFFLGDGHAVQGDGEISGNGVEISVDAQVTFRLLKGQSIGWPRFFNHQWLGAVGNARPLDQAVQHATTEMLRWLQADFGLSAAEASVLLSQCVQYDLGNVFDPAYTMVCKIARDWLPAAPLDCWK